MSKSKKSLAGMICACLLTGFGGAKAHAADSPGAAVPGAIVRDAQSNPRVFSKALVGTFNGVRVKYQATAGETFIRNERGEAAASMFTVSYVKQPAEPQRPVIFLFNGGPGTSSLFLHIGAFGPKRVVVPSDAGQAGNAPFAVVDNTDTILDVADLVFIDPIGTGYSRPLGNGKGSDYWGLKEDARVNTEFIRIWLSEHDRWNAPKYLLGESYGTMRAVQMVEEFQRSFTGVLPNGVILLSAILNLNSALSSPGNDAPYVSYLPTYAGVALFHGAINPRPEDAEKFLANARSFAIDEYAVALSKGSTLGATERAAIVDKLAYFTGLSKEYLERSDLRVSDERFRKELLRDRGQIVGSLDGRYVGQDAEHAGEQPGSDPASTAMENAYVSAYLDYLTRDLGVRFEVPYKAYSREVSANWKWREVGQWPAPIDVGPIIGQAMRVNDRFRVFLGSGIYDFSTPIFGVEQSLMHHGIKRDRVDEKRYGAGHMMYTHAPSAEAVKRDVRQFILDDRSRRVR